MSRRKLIAANWKMYKTSEDAQKFMRDFLPLISGHTRDEVAVFAPYTVLATTIEAARGSDVRVGAQNMHWEKEGAFTGEVSATMLKSIGCNSVIIGHSERRQYFCETNDTVQKKLRTALDSGIFAIVCVGERLEEREAGQTESVCCSQIGAALRGVARIDVANFVVAYEPVWAIGTGKTATPEMAGEAHAIIRAEAAKSIGNEAAQQLRILYGGSVKPENATILMSQEEIDGALVGGASLDPQSFAKIVKW